MFAHAFDDIGIPKDGFGVHTFKWLTRDGKETFIKYHWKSKQGVKSFMDGEAQAICGTDNVVKSIDAAVNAEKYPLSRESVCGIRQKTRIPKENNFAQPGELYRSWNSERRERFAMRIVDNFLLQPRVTPELQRIWIDFWSQADEELGAKLMEKVNAIAGGETVVLSSP
ncbi:hypothetical protein BSKO_07108 [Bryopsis sp. KO-2023]|nr:hypothetical protein BSKO_07108 [Bryopsis sp. KO-2023]